MSRSQRSTCRFSVMLCCAALLCSFAPLLRCVVLRCVDVPGCSFRVLLFCLVLHCVRVAFVLRSSVSVDDCRKIFRFRATRRHPTVDIGSWQLSRVRKDQRCWKASDGSSSRATWIKKSGWEQMTLTMLAIMSIEPVTMTNTRTRT